MFFSEFPENFVCIALYESQTQKTAIIFNILSKMSIAQRLLVRKLSLEQTNNQTNNFIA